MNLKQIVVLATLSFFAAFTNASTFHTEWKVPRNIHVFSTSGTVYVDMHNAGCSGSRYALPKSHPAYDTIVSFLLAAQMANKKVQLRLDGCIGNGQGKIIGVYVGS